MQKGEGNEKGEQKEMKINLNCFALIVSMITIVVKQTVSYVTHKVIHYYYIDLKVHSKNSMLHFNNSMLHSSHIQKIQCYIFNNSMLHCKTQ